MTNNRTLAPTELRAAEGAILAEELALMLEILAADARQLSAAAVENALLTPAEAGFPRALELAGQAQTLSSKAEAMLAEVRPLLDEVTGREAIASKDRTGARSH